MSSPEREPLEARSSRTVLALFSVSFEAIFFAPIYMENFAYNPETARSLGFIGTRRADNNTPNAGGV
jgi:hypothetical protein